MPTLGNVLDFAKYEARNLRIHQLGASPSSPVTGQMYYNNVDNTLYWWDGTVWVPARGGSPSGPAGGDLAGSYPNPTIGLLKITDAHVAAANKDGAVGTASMRTLGTGAQQAAAGNDARLGAASPPNGAAGGDLSGTYPNPQIAAGVITDADVAPANKDGIVGTASLRTLGAGAQQAMPGNRTLDAIANPVAARSMNGYKITGLADPTLPQDGATKLYVDSVAQGVDTKQSVRVASVANLALFDEDTVDGVSLQAGNRVLVKDQDVQTQNGIYVVVAGGSWTRATDADTVNELVGAFTFVEQGSQADTGWVCTLDQGATLGTSPIEWAQFSGAGQVVAGGGMTKTGNTLDIGAGSGITVQVDHISVANNGITNAMLADGAVNLNSADVTSTLPLGNGGTGQTTAKTARETGLAASGYYSSATHGAGTTIVISQATHGLRASRGLIVQVQLEATGAIVLPDVTVAANGDVAVTFGASVTANTYRVTIIG
jgi:hypothetical protein